MRSIRFAIAAAALIATSAMASPTDPRNGAEYTTLPTPQAVPVGKKVEVIEFFAYHCPGCNMMEPYVHALVKKTADNVTFKRIPFPFQGPTDPEARLHLTLEAMGKAEEYGPRVFRAFHIERQRLMKEDAIMEWAVKSGLDKAKFTEAWNSFGVITKLRRLPQIAASYNINSTPMFVVDGRYVVSADTVQKSNPQIPNNQIAAAMMTTIESLAMRVAKEKGYLNNAAAPAKAGAKVDAKAK
ncbi:thiol:disulfide interchange protein DsbA/DsbL [Massilia sp. PAMC28688]|uniref:thiol:disulfide interchange protein DsbA/DsbL n=1 Tax=Massilia sp. PAMC28688 TaxID=2861283 RepID=UPI001C62AAAC|nr:thiol:disulfide interchange protein DsbA/DsbL [Massilia sp. PAMC28688]QYF94040.1 thiol:disulfide interchange protein DsbA/DsbL [Massilia sp. PAMC28688]